MRRGALFLVLLAVLVLGAFLWSRRPAAKGDEAPLSSVPVVRGDFRLSVSGSGTLEGVSSVDLKAPLSGVLVQVTEVGLRVKKGAVLAEIDPGPYLRAVESAKLALQKAEAQLESAKLSLESTVTTLRQQLASAERTYQSAKGTLDETKAKLAATERLYRAGGASLEALEAARRDYAEAKLTLESAEREVAVARKNLTLKQEEGARTIAAQELAVKQARLALENAQDDLEATKIIAPMDGVVTAVNGAAGERVGAGTPLVTLVDDRSLRLVAEVDETEIGRVRVGMPALVTLEAFPDQRFEGRVTQISPAAKIVQNIPVFSVTVALPNPDRTLRVGMSAEAEIVVQRLSDVLLVPRRAVVTRGPKAFVRVRKEGKVELVPVVLGPSDGVTQVVQDGLKEGDEVVLSGSLSDLGSKRAPVRQPPLVRPRR